MDLYSNRQLIILKKTEVPSLHFHVTSLSQRQNMFQTIFLLHTLLIRIKDSSEFCVVLPCMGRNHNLLFNIQAELTNLPILPK